MPLVNMAGASTIGEVWSRLAATMKDTPQVLSVRKNDFYTGATALFSIIMKAPDAADDAGADIVKGLARELGLYQAELLVRKLGASLGVPAGGPLEAFIKGYMDRERERAPTQAAQDATSCGEPDCPFCNPEGLAKIRPQGSA